MPRNRISFNVSDKPDLAGYFSTKEPSERCTVEIEFIMNSFDGETVSGTLDKVDVKDDDYMPASLEGEDAAELGADDAVGIIIATMEDEDD